MHKKRIFVPDFFLCSSYKGRCVPNSTSVLSLPLVELLEGLGTCCQTLKDCSKSSLGQETAMSTTNPDLPFVEEDVVLDVDNSTEIQDDSMLKISNSKLSRFESFHVK